MLERGIDKKIRNKDGLSLLKVSCMESRKNIIQFLI